MMRSNKVLKENGDMISAGDRLVTNRSMEEVELITKQLSLKYPNWRFKADYAGRLHPGTKGITFSYGSSKTFSEEADEVHDWVEKLLKGGQIKEFVGLIGDKTSGTTKTPFVYKDRKELDKFKGQATVTDLKGNKLVSEDGENDISGLELEPDQSFEVFSKQELHDLGISTGKALLNALREYGDEIERMTYKSPSTDSFVLNVTFKEGSKKEYNFSVTKDRKLYIDDKVGESQVELADIGATPGSNSPIISKDVLEDEFIKYFKTLREVKKGWRDIALESYALQEAKRKQKEAELKALVEESYAEVLEEGFVEKARVLVETKKKLKEEKEVQRQAKEERIKILLQKFPSLDKAVKKLQTNDYLKFIDSIDWISPRPSMFRVNLKNGQNYLLKWLGDGFQAQIAGKRYFIDKLDEYQQALDKLGILYIEGVFKSPDEPLDTFEPPSGGGGGGGSSAPTPKAPTPETPPAGAEEGEGGGGNPELEAEPINFEEPGEAPKG